jgi:hypothetical protein
MQTTPPNRWSARTAGLVLRVGPRRPVELSYGDADDRSEAATTLDVGPPELERVVVGVARAK